jgi:hypothetical protein
MATRIHGTRHARLTRVGDLLDNLAELVITGAAILAAFIIGALVGVALLLAVMHRLGVLQ